MVNLCNLDGAILPEGETRIPVLDRGFLFGDSVYEVVRTSDGVPFAWPEHFARLRASAEALRMPLDLDDAQLARRVAATLAAAAHGDSYVRIVVTRGTGEAPKHRPRLRDRAAALAGVGAAAATGERQAGARRDRRPAAQRPPRARSRDEERQLPQQRARPRRGEGAWGDRLPDVQRAGFRHRGVDVERVRAARRRLVHAAARRRHSRRCHARAAARVPGREQGAGRRSGTSCRRTCSAPRKCSCRARCATSRR